MEEDDEGRPLIRCEDGSEIVLGDGDGEDGADGKDGKDGVDGKDGRDGKDGADGAPGADGKDGADGAPGADGKDGRDGSDGVTLVQVVGAGLDIEISGVEIPADRHPVVTLTIRDADARPLDRAGLYTEGAVSTNFVIAYLPADAAQYVPYLTSTVESDPPGSSATQPSSENNGSWTQVDAATGTYSYRFDAALPEDYDPSKTHTVAAYASRTYQGVRYDANPIFHFRPDGAAVTDARDIVTTEACNQCHTTLAEHGGRRKEVELCITCHVSGMADPETGNSIDFRVMIHKIHRGENLPSVIGGEPYKIIGFGGREHDYSDVVFPQPLENCETCHKGSDGDLWQSTQSRELCTSCHDRTGFDPDPQPPGFTAHTGGPHFDDTVCFACHAPGRGPFIGRTTDVIKVHKTAFTDPTSPVPAVDILSVSDTAPGQTPVITFTATLDGADYDLVSTPLNRLRFTFAGPTSDYVGMTQYEAQGSSPVGLVAAGSNPGEYTWTSPDTIDDIATAIGVSAEGSFAVGVEGRYAGTWTPPDGIAQNMNFPLRNDVEYFVVTGTLEPRRQSVAVARCDTCHQRIFAHGGSRDNPEYCVLCHTANLDTLGRMPAPGAGMTASTTNLRLSTMVHRIHTGDDSDKPFIAYTPSQPLDFSEVRFPGDTRACTICHLEGSFDLPLADGLLPSRSSVIDENKTRLEDTLVQATAAACAGCHDSDETLAHAETMTTAIGTEACAVCHADGSAFGLDLVHARPGL